MKKEEPTTRNTLPKEKSKLCRQSKVMRIQYFQTSFTANAKEISLGKKQKRRKRPTKNKPKTIKKMVIVSYISVITFKCKWFK